MNRKIFHKPHKQGGIMECERQPARDMLKALASDPNLNPQVREMCERSIEEDYLTEQERVKRSGRY